MGKVLPIILLFLFITSCKSKISSSTHPDPNYKHSANHKVGDDGSVEDESIVTNNHSTNYKSNFNKKQSVASDSVKVTPPSNTVHPHHYKHQF